MKFNPAKDSPDTAAQTMAVMLVHGSTRQKKEALLVIHGITPYGCYDHEPYVTTCIVQTGWTPWVHDIGRQHTREPIHTEIPNPLTKDCQFSLAPKTHNDRRCTQCIWRAVTPDQTKDTK